jgi:SAM-dependent methyltransferase
MEAVAFRQRDRADSFGTDALQYERSRPDYPSGLIDDLLIDDVHLAVDVGSGTGIVAGLLADRGCDVVGVEADARMASVAVRKGHKVEVARFEEWDSKGRTFDLLTSGQAWHWVDPAIGAQKAARVLRPRARFAVFWNGLTHPPDVAARFEQIYSRLAPHLLVDSVALGTAQPSGNRDRAAFDATGAFSEIETRTYEWQREYTTESWLDELPTHSGHRILSPTVLSQILEQVGAMLESRGGELHVDYRTAALFGRRR